MQNAVVREVNAESALEYAAAIIPSIKRIEEKHLQRGKQNGAENTLDAFIAHARVIDYL